MKNQVKKEEKTAIATELRFEIIAENETVLKTDDREEAEKKTVALQRQSKTLIIFLDHQIKGSVHYKKTEHQRNYRVIQGNYAKDHCVVVAAPIEEKISETKEENATDTK